MDPLISEDKGNMGSRQGRESAQDFPQVRKTGSFLRAPLPGPDRRAAWLSIHHKPERRVSLAISCSSCRWCWLFWEEEYRAFLASEPNQQNERRSVRALARPVGEGGADCRSKLQLSDIEIARYLAIFDLRHYSFI